MADFFSYFGSQTSTPDVGGTPGTWKTFGSISA